MDGRRLAPAAAYLDVALALFGRALPASLSGSPEAPAGWALVAVAPAALCLVVGVPLVEFQPALQSHASTRGARADPPVRPLPGHPPDADRRPP